MNESGIKSLLLIGVTALLPAISGCIPAKSGAALSSGEEIYNSTCSGCHDSPEQTRAPAKGLLTTLEAEAILGNLEGGTMVPQGLLLTREQRIAVAEYLGTGKVGDADSSIFLPTAGYCNKAGSAITYHDRGTDWNGWGADLENTRFRAEAGIDSRDVAQLQLKWVFAFPHSAMAASHPAYMDGRLFVGSITGIVYSLDAASGCIHWTHQAQAGVRAGITLGEIGEGEESRPAVFFGDTLAQVSALDADSGELLWRVQVERHTKARITGTPRYHRGRVYVPVSSLEELAAMNPNYECCTFRGSVAALSAASGRLIWQSYMITREPSVTGENGIGIRTLGPSGASVWSSPTIDTARGLLYVGTGDNYTGPATLTSDAIVALNMETGRIEWARQMLANDVYNTSCGITADELNCPVERGPDYDFASPPILRTLRNGRSVLAAGQKSGVVHGLDPDHSGALLWQTRVGRGGYVGGIQWGMGADAATLYVPVSDMDLGGNALQGGGLHALNLETGTHIWNAAPPVPPCVGTPGCSQAQSAAVTVIPGVIFSGSSDGHIRAYSSAEGSILWEFNTAREFDTVNGERGYGGSLNGSGVMVVDGMLFVTSGYYIGMPGNILLAFAAP